MKQLPSCGARNTEAPGGFPYDMYVLSGNRNIRNLPEADRPGLSPDYVQTSLRR
jgi:hypothetical protein